MLHRVHGWPVKAELAVNPHARLPLRRHGLRMDRTKALDQYDIQHLCGYGTADAGKRCGANTLPNQLRSAFVRNNAPLIPGWTKTLDGLIEQGVKVMVSCTQCSAKDLVNLELLRARVGSGSYSLWNLRCRCRLTEGCEGWSRFR